MGPQLSRSVSHSFACQQRNPWCIFFVDTLRRGANSLPSPTPKFFETEPRLSEESVVDVTVVKGKLVVASVTKPKVTLEKLLAGINEENLHGEVFSGPAVGA